MQTISRARWRCFVKRFSLLVYVSQCVDTVLTSGNIGFPILSYRLYPGILSENKISVRYSRSFQQCSSVFVCDFAIYITTCHKQLKVLENSREYTSHVTNERSTAIVFSIADRIIILMNSAFSFVACWHSRDRSLISRMIPSNRYNNSLSHSFRLHAAAIHIRAEFLRSILVLVS